MRVAVVGCGPIGTIHARAVMTSPRAQLVGLCEIDDARRKEVANRFDVPGYASVERLLDDLQPDALTVATPDHLHFDPVMAAIDAGCHVFCEKPLATTVADAQRMVSAANDRGVLLAVDYNRRFASGYRAAKAMLCDGRIGQLESCLVRVIDRTPPASVAREPYVMFGTLLTHHFDLVRWYGGEVSRLQAIVETMHGGLLRQVSLSLALASGAHATILAAYRDDQSHTTEWMALLGTSGTLVVEDLTARVILSCRAEDCVVTGATETFEDVIAASIAAHLQAFMAGIEAPQRPATGHDGLIGMKLAAAAVESIARGTSVEVTP